MFLRRALERAIGVLRRNLQARAVVTTIALSLGALVVLGGFLSFGIGNGLYQTRLDQVLDESERAVIDVQNTFAASNANDEVALQSLINSVVPRLENKSADQARLVALLRTPGQTSAAVLQSPISSDLDLSVISQSLRGKVQVTPGRLVYQATELKVGANTHPGLVVGAPVEIPLAGVYELYLVYDLQREQETLDLVQGTLVFGGLIVLLIIGLVSWWVTSRIVQPVRRAARVSEKIAEGALDERIEELFGD